MTRFCTNQPLSFLTDTSLSSTIDSLLEDDMCDISDNQDTTIVPQPQAAHIQAEGVLDEPAGSESSPGAALEDLKIEEDVDMAVGGSCVKDSGLADAVRRGSKAIALIEEASALITSLWTMEGIDTSMMNVVDGLVSSVENVVSSSSAQHQFGLSVMDGVSDHFFFSIG